MPIVLAALAQMLGACGSVSPSTRPDGSPILVTGPMVGDAEQGEKYPQALRPTIELSHSEPDAYPLFVQARFHNATVFGGQEAKVGRGLIRFGAATKARAVGPGEQCPGGSWYEVRDGGYVCTSLGFKPLPNAPKTVASRVQPDIESALPYGYVKLTRKPALRLSRLPSADELKRLQTLQNSAPDSVKHLPFVRDELSSIHFLAVTDQIQGENGKTYFRTVRGDYVRAEDVEPVAAVPMRGQRVRDGLHQPLGFIVGSAHVPVFRVDQDKVEAIGWGEKFGRRTLQKRVQLADRALWLIDDELALDETDLRIASRIARPPGIAAHERWVHIDLPQQTLVAYRGDEPIYATLVSTGKEGHETPTGLFHIRHKYISITMSGRDPVDGDYEIEEVPWTHYYQGSYAIHAAFWHTDFGQVRSHGCTNVAPEDARWLYNFTAPHVPKGWHGVWEPGTAVYITGAPGPDSET